MKPSLIIPSRWTEETQQARRLYSCQHRHNGLRHPKCYERENGIKERIGCLDIEAGGLKANVDIMLSWAIKTFDKDEIWYDNVTPQSLNNGIRDSKILGTLVDKMWDYDRIVTHYGANFRFDIPFIRTRALILAKQGLFDMADFPKGGLNPEMWLSDTYPMAKKYLKLTSNRQDCIGETILAENIKTRVDFRYWESVKYGSIKEKKQALDYIVEHNLRDAEQLEDNYRLLRQFAREVRSAI